MWLVILQIDMRTLGFVFFGNIMMSDMILLSLKEFEYIFKIHKTKNLKCLLMPNKPVTSILSHVGYKSFYKACYVSLVLSCVSCARQIQYGPYRSSHNHTIHTTSGCDPDYGWIPGVDGTKCYMILRVSITRVELALTLMFH